MIPTPAERRQWQAWIDRQLAASPPLTEAKKRRLAFLLNPPPARRVLARR